MDLERHNHIPSYGQHIMYCMPDYRFAKHLSDHYSEEKEKASDQFEHFVGELGCRGSFSGRSLYAYDNHVRRVTSPKGCRPLDL